MIEPLEVPIVTEPQLISLGEFKITAYCSCYICCDEYAQNRPIDENGNEIVVGSIGQVLTPEYSIAVDPSVIPYGTVVYFNGNEYIAQDCGGAIKENRIDLYFDSHQDALEYGVQYHEVFILESEGK
jgi:3D (Asp-Asp-Asp) domain-containing protein